MLAGKLLAEYPKIKLFCLYGDLGSGKTVFCKGLALTLGIPEKKIKSPTFTLIRPHGGIFYHCDFYRIGKNDELITRQLLEIFSCGDALTAIEWPQALEGRLPKKRLNIYFKYHDEGTRIIQVKEND